jgi:hypothetical protein
MSVTQLDTPYLDGGMHLTNFFNGRILSREDMKREQDAERAVHERLGRVLGDGIARGFEVEATSIGGSSITYPVVRVHAGLAINRRGQTVALDRDVDVSLLKPAASQSNGTTLLGSFNDCAPQENAVYVVGSGVYLLTVAPAQVKQGLALVSGLGNERASCNIKEVVEGVQFRLFQVTALSDKELADEAHLRNVAAYKFFFADGVGTDLARDPFGVPTPSKPLTDVPLTDCDVPLALLHWTDVGGLRWVDLWSVRRRFVPPSPGGSWTRFDREPRAAAGMAMVLQFQAELADLPVAAKASFKATDQFTHLPPLGMIPVQDFDLVTLFSGLKRRRIPAYIEGAKLPSLISDAIEHPPIDLLASAQEAIWTYFVHENMRAVDVATPPVPQPYLVFTNGQVKYRGNARFDLSYWNYASYALL